MDTGALFILLAFMVPLTAIVVKSPLGKALADRIAGRIAEDPHLLAEIESLRAELDQVHEHLAEVNERLDFSERLLAQHNPDMVTPPEGMAR